MALAFNIKKVLRLLGIGAEGESYNNKVKETVLKLKSNLIKVIYLLLAASIPCAHFFCRHGIARNKMNPQKNYYPCLALGATSNTDLVIYLNLQLNSEILRLQYSATADLVPELPAKNINEDILLPSEYNEIRKFYTQKRQNGWNVLQEILRIELDQGHPHNSEAQKLVKELLDRFGLQLVAEHFFKIFKMCSGYPRQLISHLKVLNEWKHQPIDESKFKELGLSQLQSFIHADAIAWVAATCIEIESVLDLLILFAYSQLVLDLASVSDIMQALFRFRDMSDWMEHYAGRSSTAVDVARLTLRIHFKFITLFSAAFQFWRVYEAAEESSRSSSSPLPHPMMEMIPKDARLVRDISRSIIQSIEAEGLRGQSNPVHVRTYQLVLFLWFHFLENFSANFSFEKNDIQDFLMRDRAEPFGSVSTHLVALTRSVYQNHVSSSSSRERNPSFLSPSSPADEEFLGMEYRPNILIYCHIMQEVLNLMIDKQILADVRNGVAPEDMVSIALLADLFYQANAVLCEKFWTFWTNMESDAVDSQGKPLPLYQLLKLLLERCPHDPVYCLQLFNALACSPRAVYALMDALNQPVRAISPIDLCDLQLEEEGDDASVSVSVGSQVRLGRRRQGGQGRLTSLLMRPPVGTGGLVIQCDPAEPRAIALVQWNHMCNWWTVLFELLLESCFAAASAARENPSDTVEVSVKSASVYTFLRRIMSHQALLAEYYLKLKWNELSLYGLLCNLQLVDVYSALTSQGETISRLRNDAKASFDRLLSYGVHQDAAQRLIQAVCLQNPSDEVFLWSLGDLMGRSLCSTWIDLLTSAHFSTTFSSSSDRRDVCFDLASGSLEVLTALVEVGDAVSVDVLSTIHVEFLVKRKRPFHEFLLHLCGSYSSTTTSVLFPVVNRQAKAMLKARNLKEARVDYWSALFSSAATGSKHAQLQRGDFERALQGFDCAFPSSVLSALFQSSRGSPSSPTSSTSRGGDSIGVEECIAFFAEVDRSPRFTEMEVSEIKRQRDLLKQRISESIDSTRSGSRDFSARYIDVLLFEVNYAVKVLTTRGFVLETVAMLSGCIDALDAFLSSAVLSDRYTLCTRLASEENTIALEVLLQAVLSFGLVALKHRNMSTALGSHAAARSFKTLLYVDARSSKSPSGSQLPIDFNAYLPFLSLQLADTLIDLALKAGEWLTRLLETADAVGAVPLLQSISSLFTSKAQLFLQITNESVRGLGGGGEGGMHTGSIGDYSYIAVLAGMLNLSLVHSSILVKRLKIMYTHLLGKAILAVSEGKGRVGEPSSSQKYYVSPLVTCIGIQNISGFCGMLVENVLQQRSSASFSASLRSASLHLLLTIAECQLPAIAAIMGIGRSTVTVSGTGSESKPVVDSFCCRPEESLIVTMLLSLIDKAEELHNTHPADLLLVYRVIKICWEAKYEMNLVRASIYMIQSHDFWTNLTKPLMVDVQPLLLPPLPLSPPPPSPHSHIELGAALDECITDTIHSESSQEAADAYTSAVDAVKLHLLAGGGSGGGSGGVRAAEVDMFCQQLLVHATILQLLALEKHGLFFEIDATAAMAAYKKVSE